LAGRAVELGGLQFFKLPSRLTSLLSIARNEMVRAVLHLCHLGAYWISGNAREDVEVSDGGSSSPMVDIQLSEGNVL
jgi:hypothetical protein